MTRAHQGIKTMSSLKLYIFQEALRLEAQLSTKQLRKKGHPSAKDLSKEKCLCQRAKGHGGGGDSQETSNEGRITKLWCQFWGSKLVSGSAHLISENFSFHNPETGKPMWMPFNCWWGRLFSSEQRFANGYRLAWQNQVVCSKKLLCVWPNVTQTAVKKGGNIANVGWAWEPDKAAHTDEHKAGLIDFL